MSDYFRFAVLKSNWTIEKTRETAEAYARATSLITTDSLTKLRESLHQFLKVVEPLTMPTLFSFVDTLIREKGVFAKTLLPELVAHARCIFPPTMSASEEQCKTQILKQLRMICERWRRDGFLNDDDFGHLWNTKRARRTTFFQTLFQKEDEAAARLKEEHGVSMYMPVLENGSQISVCAWCGDGFVRMFNDEANTWQLVDGYAEEDMTVLHYTCKQNRDGMLNTFP